MALVFSTSHPPSKKGFTLGEESLGGRNPGGSEDFYSFYPVSYQLNFIDILSEKEHFGL